MKSFTEFFSKLLGSKKVRKNEENLTKDWTEPNGVFILRIPVEWQYCNPLLEQSKEAHKIIHSFEAYNETCGCFQLSSYSDEEIKFNDDFITQKSNEKLN